MSLLHPAVGRIDLHVEVIFGDSREQKLFLISARGGSAHEAKLRKLSLDPPMSAGATPRQS